MTRGEEILDCGGGRGEGEKRNEAVSLFSFHLSPFPPETPDTQAITARGLCSANSSI